jgi:hypothetical protein
MPGSSPSHSSTSSRRNWRRKKLKSNSATVILQIGFAPAQADQARSSKNFIFKI